ncbi:unnamed protein product [Thelazia callipaeda]|uniref:Capsid protein n=1 Tax=Thelazia callipaeda TaxID=103827 RepID=A0A0N5CYL4_THECL|nr:unnamed protein product [Thelazia callipaeda]
MVMSKWSLLERNRKPRQIRMRTNAAGRQKQQRVRKLRLQHLLKESTSSSAGMSRYSYVAMISLETFYSVFFSFQETRSTVDNSNNIKTKTVAWLQNPDVSTEPKQDIVDDDGDSRVSNADYFHAIVHAVAPGPLDIPAIYRTHAIIPSATQENISTAVSLAPESFFNKGDKKESVYIEKTDKISLISANYTTAKCTLYTGIHWNATTNFGSDHVGKQSLRKFIT